MWVSRGKSRATADRPVDVEISDQFSPVQSSAVQGQVKAHFAAKAQSRKKQGRARQRTGWLMDDG